MDGTEKKSLVTDDFHCWEHGQQRTAAATVSGYPQNSPVDHQSRVECAARGIEAEEDYCCIAQGPA